MRRNTKRLLKWGIRDELQKRLVNLGIRDELCYIDATISFAQPTSAIEHKVLLLPVACHPCSKTFVHRVHSHKLVEGIVWLFAQGAAYQRLARPRYMQPCTAPTDEPLAPRLALSIFP